jgi:hypothetical protein
LTFVLQDFQLGKRTVTLRLEKGEFVTDIKFHLVYSLEIPTVFEGLDIWEASSKDRAAIRPMVSNADDLDESDWYIIQSNGRKYFIVCQYVIVEEKQLTQV